MLRSKWTGCDAPRAPPLLATRETRASDTNGDVPLAGPLVAEQRPGRANSTSPKWLITAKASVV
jgi:hypothetical protein